MMHLIFNLMTFEKKNIKPRRILKCIANALENKNAIKNVIYVNRHHFHLLFCQNLTLKILFLKEFLFCQRKFLGNNYKTNI